MISDLHLFIAGITSMMMQQCRHCQFVCRLHGQWYVPGPRKWKNITQRCYVPGPWKWKNITRQYYVLGPWKWKNITRQYYVLGPW
ncbi:hypothetical protein GDO81_007157 [Engystomops pustulosus]|uniref:Uncharacterized protein n=1 Tax=Engystomops pustulosus TaxID=76066 RepID=A0AAV7C577_ENGPU|nr:hypothetical protein GDO81_007157 [Engystomops pustulosus]